MAMIDYGTLILKNNNIVINEDTWTKYDLEISDNFIISFYKCGFDVKYNGRTKNYIFNNVSENITRMFGIDYMPIKYVFKIEIDDIKLKVKRLKCNFYQFLLTFNYGEDSYKVLFGYGVGCDWINKKARKFFERFERGE